MSSLFYVLWDVWEQNYWGFIFALALFLIGWIFGSFNERQHFKRLLINEDRLQHITLSNERVCQIATEPNATLLVANVCIAQDRFKQVISGLLNLFGRNLTVYESLLERGKREAIIRLKQQAHEQGYHHIYGVRIETANTDIGGIEIFAYGTAVAHTSSNTLKSPPR